MYFLGVFSEARAIHHRCCLGNLWAMSSYNFDVSFYTHRWHVIQQQQPVVKNSTSFFRATLRPRDTHFSLPFVPLFPKPIFLFICKYFLKNVVLFGHFQSILDVFWIHFGYIWAIIWTHFNSNFAQKKSIFSGKVWLRWPSFCTKTFDDCKKEKNGIKELHKVNF